MKFFQSGLLCLLLAAINSGCITTEDPAARMREREDLIALQDRLTRTEGRLETLEMEYQRVINNMRELSDGRSESGAQQRSIQTRMDAMEQRLAAVDAARERDRQAIVDQLSGRIAEVMRASNRSAASSSGGGVGYEHVVQQGETLSAIASAYKVTVKAIIEANNLQNPDHLRKGQKLFIPQ
ncbi:MAG: LysM peptidoglycan-binding domain-containing protein [Kiritimatiellia bacterium]|jgi:septal ring factor EnvC (AmiA/AmiB activator)